MAKKMVKFTQLCSKTFKITFCILLLVLSSNSARILNELSSDEPDVSPVVAPVGTLPSGHFPATTTTPETPVDDDSSVPATVVAPSVDSPEPAPIVPTDLPDEPEPHVAPAAPGAATSVTNAAPGAVATVVNPIPDHSTFSFIMHDILGGTHPSGRVVTGIVATTDANNLPFTNANNNVFPLDGGVPLNDINNYPFLAGLNGQQQSTTLNGQQQSTILLQNTGNNDIVNTEDNQPFVTAGQLPSGLTLQQLMFGSITVVDNQITQGHELGSSILGKAQGFYLTSSSDGTSHTLALTTLFHGQHEHEVDDTLSFFGVHRTATPISHIAIIGGTGKYENAKGYATIETMPYVDQHTTDGVETITHFTVYIAP